MYKISLVNIPIYDEEYVFETYEEVAMNMFTILSYAIPFVNNESKIIISFDDTITK